MGYRKRNRFVVALFLLCTVFASNALAGACFCGQACMHGLQSKAKIKVNLPFHVRCSGTLCKSCNLEESQTLKAANSAAWTHHVKIIDTAMVCTLADCPTTYHILNDSNLFSTWRANPSTPIYLQNLSILC